jgi:hypothetical protein
MRVSPLPKLQRPLDVSPVLQSAFLHHNAKDAARIDHFPLILGGILIDFAIALSWNFENNDTVNQPEHAM